MFSITPFSPGPRSRGVRETRNRLGLGKRKLTINEIKEAVELNVFYQSSVFISIGFTVADSFCINVCEENQVIRVIGDSRDFYFSGDEKVRKHLTGQKELFLICL